jgi:hypothetical protein
MAPANVLRAGEYGTWNIQEIPTASFVGAVSTLVSCPDTFVPATC